LEGSIQQKEVFKTLLAIQDQLVASPSSRQDMSSNKYSKIKENAITTAADEEEEEEVASGVTSQQHSINMLGKLPKASQDELLSALHALSPTVAPPSPSSDNTNNNNEDNNDNSSNNSNTVTFAATPSYLLAHGTVLVACSIGTVGFVVLLLLVVLTSSSSSLLLVMSCFPLALGATLWAYRAHKKRFFAFTNKYVVIASGGSTPCIFTISSIVSVDQRMNWLYLRKEIVIRRKINKPDVKFPKQEFIDSLPKKTLEQAYQLLKRKVEANNSNI